MVPECCFGADTIKLIKKALGCNRMPRAKLGTEPRENGGISPFLGRLRSHVEGSKEANGARGRSRTADTVIFSHVLYQLSYPGIVSQSPPWGSRALEARLWRRRSGLSSP